MKKIVTGISAMLIIIAAVAATLALNSPSQCNGQWTSCGNAFADGGSYATAKNGNIGTWSSYGVSLPSSTQINQVRVRADFWSTTTSASLDVSVSGDNGTTFGTVHRITGTSSEQTFWIDITNDTNWTTTKLDNAHFVVKAKCVASGPGGSSKDTCKLDWVPVEVTYTPFDFSLTANPDGGTVIQGDGANSTITVSLLGGIPQQVSLAVQNCPQTVTCLLNPMNGNPSFTSGLTIRTNVTTPTGTYVINVTGTGDGKVRSATYTLTVNPTCVRADPTVSITPTIQQGNPGFGENYTVTVHDNDNAACGNATFNLSDAIPSGWMGYFDEWSLTMASGDERSTWFFLISAGNATEGNYTFSNTAKNQDFPLFSGTASAIYQVTSPPFDFWVSLNPASGQVMQGYSKTSTVTVGLLSGMPQDVSLSVEGCPDTVTCLVDPWHGNPTFQSTLTLRTNVTTPPGVYVINVSGNGSGLMRKATYTLTVVSTCVRQNPSVSIVPSVQYGHAGTMLNYTTTVTNNDNGGCGPSWFNLSSTVPSSWFGWFNESSVYLAPGFAKGVTFSVYAPQNIPNGNWTFTNKASNAAFPSYYATATGMFVVY